MTQTYPPPVESLHSLITGSDKVKRCLISKMEQTVTSHLTANMSNSTRGSEVTYRAMKVSVEQH